MATNGATSTLPTQPTSSASNGATSTLPTQPPAMATSGAISKLPTQPPTTGSSGATSTFPTQPTSSASNGTRNTTMPLSTTSFPTPPALTCYQCGDASTPCSPMELLLGQPQPCPQGTSYCMVDISQAAGTREVRKRCVDHATCLREWYDVTSDDSKCIAFDPRDTTTQLDCHFCCVTDNCNRQLKPARSLTFML
ncbi:succinate dehydrogenase [ubiquinone] flavoprotein subunit, mitochondrial [Elysia marginata]|uniref:Succinate dehydrogenase [ubiquinone] flavoprotein subunit, mitochondrial n=1 Tax=Elysia marginata TaxID=1093978 RepID=A0AAV4ES33_9GAST|nr:succinate dehydrogenase [ubiquinone] flavoprotein subunit, mitochondrial [Elysia marginata]